jgi:hypothetical protein
MTEFIEFDDTFAVPKLTFGQPELTLCRKFVENQRANMAREMIIRLALIAGKSGGEDSAGRHYLTDRPAAEVAAYACDVAAATYDEFELRGWLQTMPDPNQIEAMAKKANVKP